MYFFCHVQRRGSNPATSEIRYLWVYMAFCMRNAQTNVLALSKDTRILLPSERFLGKSNII